MKHKKSLLTLIAFSIFAGIVATQNVHAEEGPITVDVCPEYTDQKVYKVDKDYTGETLVNFDIAGCAVVEFDLNGKKVDNGSVGTWSSARMEQVNLRLVDSVGGGYFKGYNGDRETMTPVVDTVAIESGIWNGDIHGKESVLISGGNVSSSFISSVSSIEISGGILTEASVSSGKVNISGGTFNNDFVAMSGRIEISGGMFNSPIGVTPTVTELEITGGEFYNSIIGNGNVHINGGIFHDVNFGENVTIHKGIFLQRPDNKYLADDTEIYEKDGKYIVDYEFALTGFLQYMYSGQTYDRAIVGPAMVAKTFEITSSDKSVVDFSCEEVNPENSGSMYKDGYKVCTAVAKKTGKSTISYTTGYGHSGEFVTYVADVDASDYGNAADQVKYGFIAELNSSNCVLYNKVDGSMNVTCSSLAIGGSASKITLATEAFEAGHKIKLALGYEETTLDEDEKELLKDKNIAAAYITSGSIMDATSNETIADGWVTSISRVPLPKILENRKRAVQIATIIAKTNTADGSVGVNLFDAAVEGDFINVNDSMQLYASKYVVLYDGDPITEDSLPDVPAVPNSAGFDDEQSAAIFIGAAISIVLIITVITIYANNRKKALNKVRF